MELPGIPEICLALIFYILLTYCLKREKGRWSSSLVETLPWFLANIHRIHQIAVEFLQRDNGTYFLKGMWWLGSYDFLATVDPANIHYITTTNFPNYPKGDEYRKVFDVMGYAFFNSDDEDWKFYRRLIHAPIKSQKFLNHSMKTAHAKLGQVLVPLLKHASQQKDYILDMQDVFNRFALDVVCKSLADHDPATLSIDLPKVPFLEALVDFEGGIIYRMALPEILWKLQLVTRKGPENRLARARKVIKWYISDMVSRKRQDVSNKNICDENDEDADLLTLLMKDVNNHQDININVHEFYRDVTLQLLIAGRDTTSAAMTWFIWLIMKHPEIEKKIRDEIKAKIGGANINEWRVFTFEETSQLVYLHAALCESLRLYPPVPFQYKSVRQSDILPSGHPVHPKTKILIFLYAMARMKAIWGENCSNFEPERWISERGTIKHEPSNKFLVFYAGPRSCMGKDASMKQMKMVAATLIHNFRFQLVEGHTIQPDVSMILHMKHGLKVRIYNRWM